MTQYKPDKIFWTIIARCNDGQELFIRWEAAGARNFTDEIMEGGNRLSKMLGGSTPYLVWVCPTCNTLVKTCMPTLDAWRTGRWTYPRCGCGPNEWTAIAGYTLLYCDELKGIRPTIEAHDKKILERYLAA